MGTKKRDSKPEPLPECANWESNPDYKNRNLVCDPLHYRRITFIILTYSP